MEKSSILEKAVEAIVVLNAALTNIRLYPPSSAMIVNSVDSAQSILQSILEEEASIVFAESDKNLIISGQALDEKEQKKPQVAAFIQLMLNLGIKSIAFEKGLEKSDIIDLLEVISKKPDDLRKQGGIQKIMSAKQTKHIMLDQKLYVAMDKDQRIVPGGDIKDADETAPAEVPPIEDERRSGEDRRKEDSLEYLAQGGVERRNQEQRKKQLLHIQNGINSILKGEEKYFTDRQVMHSLAPTFLDLLSHGKDKVTDAIIDRLGEGLLKKEGNIRAEVASVLARIGIKLISDKRMDIMIKVSHKLIEWIKFETLVPPAYKHVCAQLKGMLQYLILNQRFEEAKQLLTPFHLIYSGEIKKEDNIQHLSGNVLEGVLSDKVIEALISAAGTGEQGPGAQAVEIMDTLASASPAARDAMQQIKTTSIEKQETTPAKTEPAGDVLSEQMALVDQHVEKGDTESAVKLLFDMIVKYAEEKDFQTAESLRDRLMEVNPMALTEIVKSGEIIDEGKSGSIDQEHLDTWAELYKNLTQEETSTLFYAMKSAKFKPKQFPFRQGERNSNLYFINKGQLRMFFMEEEEEKVIKELDEGDVMGEETFFNLTVSTVSVMALSEAEVNVLEKDVLTKWEERDLGIESKLRDYCLRLDKISDLLKKKRLDRRSQKRIEISNKVSIQSLDTSGTPKGKSLTGTLADICEGGVSFYLKSPKENVVNMFAEPRMNLRFIINTGESQQNIEQTGTVVAAIHHFYDFSIHVKFDKMLDDKTIQDIKTSGGGKDKELEILTDS
jgi:CRP-like cAMP-binding protein